MRDRKYWFLISLVGGGAFLCGSSATDSCTEAEGRRNGSCERVMDLHKVYVKLSEHFFFFTAKGAAQGL